MYNFDFSTGALKPAHGIAPLRVPSALYGIVPGEQRFTWLRLPSDGFKPYACYHYRFYDPLQNFAKAHKLVIIGKDKRIFQIDLPTVDGEFPNNWFELMSPSMPKDVINYRLNNSDVLIMCFEEGNMHVYDAGKDIANRLTCVHGAPNFLSMCVHYERLFAIADGHKNAVWFSKELDPTMWDISLGGAGFIEMIDERGECTKVVSFGGYVYIFREYGIARLSAFADQEQFSLTQLFTSSGRIYEDTVTICGDRIMFIAEDGLYVFDGISTRRIGTNIERLFVAEKNKHAKATFYNGKYYLACCLDFGDKVLFGCESENLPPNAKNFVNNALIEIDLRVSRLTVTRGVDIGFLGTINEEDYSQLILCCNNDADTHVWEVLPGGESVFFEAPHRVWQSPKTDFGHTGKNKVVREEK
jgi:hypothetical protein